MIKQLLFFFCPFSFTSGMNHKWVPVIKGTINNNTDNPISVEIIVDDPDNTLTPKEIAKINATVHACCQKNFEIEFERT